MEYDIVSVVLEEEERKILDKIKKIKNLKKDEDVLRLGLRLLESVTNSIDTSPEVKMVRLKPGPADEVKLPEDFVYSLAQKITSHIVGSLKNNMTKPDAFNFKVVGTKKGGKFGSFGGGKGGTSMGL